MECYYTFNDKDHWNPGFWILDLVIYLFSNTQTHKDIYYISETEVIFIKGLIPHVSEASL